MQPAPRNARPARLRARSIAHGALLAGLLAGLAAPVAQAQTFPDIVDRVRPSIVGVGTLLATRRPPASLMGTGFVIGDGRLVATNHHVLPPPADLEQFEKLVVFSGRGRDSQAHEVRIVATDERHDLTVLALNAGRLPALALAQQWTVREGQEIAFTGFPIGAVLGLYPVTHRGIVSAITPVVIPARASSELSAAQVRALRDPYEVIQLDATAYPGNSGSPVYLREDGTVIGVVNQVLVKGTKENVLKDPSAITYAIPVRFLDQLVREAAAP